MKHWSDAIIITSLVLLVALVFGFCAGVLRDRGKSIHIGSAEKQYCTSIPCYNCRTKIRIWVDVGRRLPTNIECPVCKVEAVNPAAEK